MAWLPPRAIVSPGHAVGGGADLHQSEAAPPRLGLAGGRIGRPTGEVQQMKKLVLFAVVAVVVPLGVSASVVTESGGPYDVTSDVLFTGIATSDAGGAGSYVVSFFTPGASVTAVADAAVTQATVDASFTDLTMSWIDGLALNAIVSASGVDTLSTVFDMTFPVQQLRFDWTNSVAGQGFRFDVTTEAMVSTIPVPASILLLLSGLGGLGLLGARGKLSGRRPA